MVLPSLPSGEVVAVATLISSPWGPAELGEADIPTGGVNSLVSLYSEIVST